MGATENNELEYQIIETAKQLFIEKGFVFLLLFLLPA